jgi:hypothetical protein
MTSLPLRHRLTSTADTGLAFATGQLPLPPATAQDVIGFTRPDGIYERMQGIQADALHLDAAVQLHFPNPAPGSAQAAFKASWRGWYDNWRPLYETYAGPNPSRTARLGMLYPGRSDEFNEIVNKRQRQFEELLAEYNSQTRPNGQPVPQISSTAKPPSPSGGFALPWWFWLAGGVVLVGAGYLVYRKVREGQAKAKVAHKYAPALLERFLGPAGKPAYEYSQAGRDLDLVTSSPVARDLAIYEEGMP